MAEKPSVHPPPQTGTHTPGWNDPPPMNYNPLSPNNSTNRPKLNLNKRVAFPLQGSPLSSANIAKPTAIVQPSQSTPLSSPPLTALSSANAPPLSQPIAVVHPMPNVNASIPINRLSTTTEIQEELPLDAKEKTFCILLQCIPLIQESQNIRIEEIERRISCIDNLWVSGTLSQAVKHKIYKIAKAIEKKNGKEAMEAYTSLVVNHSNECSFWATALRHIVLTQQVQNQSIETSSATLPLNCMPVPAIPRSAEVTPTAEDGEMSNAFGVSRSTVSNAASNTYDI